MIDHHIIRRVNAALEKVNDKFKKTIYMCTCAHTYLAQAQ